MNAFHNKPEVTLRQAALAGTEQECLKTQQGLDSPGNKLAAVEAAKKQIGQANVRGWQIAPAILCKGPAITSTNRCKPSKL